MAAADSAPSAEQYAATIRRGLGVIEETCSIPSVSLWASTPLMQDRQEALPALAALLEQQQQQEAKIKELEATAEAVARERDEANQHLGVDPSMERIREAHSAMTALTPESRQGWHLPYKQGHDERCYICTLLDRAVRAERLLDEARRENECWDECANLMFDALLLIRDEPGVDGSWCAGAAMSAIAALDERRRKWQSHAPRFLPTWLGGEANRVSGPGARLGAAAPQQEPATSGDEPSSSVVAEVSET